MPCLTSEEKAGSPEILEVVAELKSFREELTHSVQALGKQVETGEKSVADQLAKSNEYLSSLRSIAVFSGPAMGMAAIACLMFAGYFSLICLLGMIGSMFARKQFLQEQGLLATKSSKKKKKKKKLIHRKTGLSEGKGSYAELVTLVETDDDGAQSPGTKEQSLPRSPRKYGLQQEIDISQSSSPRKSTEALSKMTEGVSKTTEAAMSKATTEKNSPRKTSDEAEKRGSLRSKEEDRRKSRGKDVRKSDPSSVQRRSGSNWR